MLESIWANLGLSIKFLYPFLNLLLLTGNLEEEKIWQSIHNLYQDNTHTSYEVKKIYCHAQRTLEENGAYLVYIDERKLRQALKNKITSEYSDLNGDISKLTKALSNIKFKNKKAINNTILKDRADSLRLSEKVRMISALEQTVNSNIEGVITRSFEDFNPNKLAGELFYDKESLKLTESDITDFLVYLGQSLFLRKSGEERESNKEARFLQYNKPKIKEQLQKLELLQKKLPSKNKNYAETLVLGAGYDAFKYRTKFAKELLDKGYETGKIRLTSGFRELWASIDAKTVKNERGKIIGRNIEYGKKRMLKLATKFNIKYNPEKPFIKYVQSAEIEQEKQKQPENVEIENLRYMPDHRLAYKIYLNTPPDSTYLTELHIAKHVGDKLLSGIDYEIVYSNLTPGKRRAYTLETINEAIKTSKLDNYEGKSIIAVSNQPFISRQSYEAKRAFFNHGYKNITIDGAGYGISMPIINAGEELAIELLNRYQANSSDQSRLKQIKKTTRRNISTPPIPNYGEECNL
jgi:hypothetical protein